MDRGKFIKVLGSSTLGLVLGGVGSAKVLSPNIVKDKKPRNQEAIVTKPVTAIVIGAGSRGSTYAGYALQYPKSLQIVGVSDILEDRKTTMGNEHNIEEKYRFGDWSEVFKQPKFADAVIISTPDNLHYEPCMKALEMGYDVLLEKPIAPTPEQCENIAMQAKKHNRIVGVCHVLRYAPYFLALKEMLDKGVVGDIISVHHFEPIRFHHMAHSYVRGNWHNSKETTPIVLAKSCHDLDIIRWMLNEDCTEISTYGGLRHFTRNNAPEDSSERCLQCSVESKCPFSAVKIYLRDKRYLYVFDLPNDKSKHDAIIMDKLKNTNYGRCVYRCDNDQCDHYAVNMKFESGTIVSFTMEAFTSYGGRRTVILGTKGDIVGDMKSFTVTDFLTEKKTVWAEDISDLPGYQGHAGGDWGIIKDFVLAVSNQDEKFLSSTVDISVASHLIGFKSEESRLSGKNLKLK